MPHDLAAEDAQIGVAVILDVRGSRRLSDRVAGQRQLEQVLADVNRAVPALQPLEPTVGDECQGLYRSTEGALEATLRVLLGVHEPVDCRFGIGAGRFHRIETGSSSRIQDGSAWWSARDAIDTTKSKETKKPILRTWYARGSDLSDAELRESPSPDVVTAYLLARDFLVSRMSDRSRRLLLGLLDGRSQVELAAAEGILQGSVSLNLKNSGAQSLYDGMIELRRD